MTSAVEQLEQLLATERQALRAGQLGDLVTLSEEKAQIADRLERDTTLTAPQLRQASAALEAQAHLIKAAQAGIRDVLTRLQAQKQARESLTTYDRDGRGAKIGTPQGGTLRRF